MKSRRNFLHKSSFGLVSIPLLPELWQKDGLLNLLADHEQDPFETLRNELLLEDGLTYFNTATLDHLLKVSLKVLRKYWTC